jgi:tRNA A37 threonylcarbamoyladenosine modification protein TsaB
MISLFIDTSYKLQLGLEKDDVFSHAEMSEPHSARVSSSVHWEIHQLLEKYQTLFSEIDSLIFCIGPGFYTGLRVSLGLANHFSLLNKKVYFYEFHKLPFYCGFQHYIWCAKAYRGEYFLAEVSPEGVTTKLLSALDLKHWGEENKKELANSVAFYPSPEAFDPVLQEMSSFFREIRCLEKAGLENYFRIKPFVKEWTPLQDVFYFREREVEFKPSQKE